MSEKRIKVGLLFGGKSAEHEISINSAFAVMKYIDYKKYDVNCVYVKNNGDFATPMETYKKVCELIEKDDNINEKNEWEEFPYEYAEMIKTYPFYSQDENVNKVSFVSNLFEKKFDIIFPIFHGKNGEDGTIQGMCQFLGIPYVGCNVKASVLSIDKELTKKIAMQNNIPVVEYMCVTPENWIFAREHIVTDIEENMGFPVFIKPSESGSSIGISLAKNISELEKGINNAFSYDDKIIVEKALNIKEYAIGIIGNSKLEISGICEFFAEREFYNYESKYTDEAGIGIIPAVLDEISKNIIITLAKKVWKAFDLEGMARIDFFYDNSNIYLNEINTIPGLGGYSVFPKMWEKKGISKVVLIDKIIEYGFERFEKDKRIKYSVE